MPSPTTTRVTLLACGLTILLGACGSGRAGPKMAADEVRRWFDNAIREAPMVERSEWTEGEQEDLLRRVGMADAVAVGTISLVSDARFHQRSQSLTLAFSAKEVLHGSIDKKHADGGSVYLSLDSTASRKAARAIAPSADTEQRRYVLFLKHLDSEGKIRWVLYRSSDALIKQVRSMYRLLSKKRR